MKSRKKAAVLSCVIATCVAAITACGGQPQGTAGSICMKLDGVLK